MCSSTIHECPKCGWRTDIKTNDNFCPVCDWRQHALGLERQLASMKKQLAEAERGDE